jgi:eukaryotic-like serine/threonine-protein kinase
LADFGLAVLAENRDESMTLETLTPAYAPREMFRPRTPPSSAADIYSLCATLYALLSGRPPRWDNDHNPSLVALLEIFDRPVPDIPGVPDALVATLRLGLGNDPAARPSAIRLRDMLLDLKLDGTDPLPVSPPRGSDDETTDSWVLQDRTQNFSYDEPTTIMRLGDLG